MFFIFVANMEFVGRIYETKRLNEIFNRNRSEFLVVYGRRRIGKTFLLRHTFSKRISFHHTALANSGLNAQLLNFNTSLHRSFGSLLPHSPPQNWIEAFQRLQKGLEQLPDGKKLVFIDELPWLDTPRSGFLPAFEHFWNSWAAARNDIMLVVCGSAASWMISKILKNRGGLHNRVTERMHLKPFTLAECKMLTKELGIEWNLHQLMEVYMILGGVPYYWSLLPRGKSAAQAIDTLLFGDNALLGHELTNLYASLFKKYRTHVAIIRALASRKIGLTRDALIRQSKMPNGGGTTRVLEELEQSDFIRKYTPIGRKSRESLYQLCDFFSLFHFNFIENKQQRQANTWLSQLDHPQHRTWSGYAFELLCLQHTEHIKKALGISGVDIRVASWRSAGQKPLQVDLLFERRDKIINLFEIKFSSAPFALDKKYAAELAEKLETFRRETKTRSAVHLSMISPYGLKSNTWSGMVQVNLEGEDFL